MAGQWASPFRDGAFMGDTGRPYVGSRPAHSPSRGGSGACSPVRGQSSSHPAPGSPPPPTIAPTPVLLIPFPYLLPWLYACALAQPRGGAAQEQSPPHSGWRGRTKPAGKPSPHVSSSTPGPKAAGGGAGGSAVKDHSQTGRRRRHRMANLGLSAAKVNLRSTPLAADTCATVSTAGRDRHAATGAWSATERELFASPAPTSATGRSTGGGGQGTGADEEMGEEKDGVEGVPAPSPRPKSPVRGDIAPDESQVAAHEFRGLWRIAEEKKKKAEASLFQARKESECLRERVASLDDRLRGALESQGDAEASLRKGQVQLLAARKRVGSLEGAEAALQQLLSAAERGQRAESARLRKAEAEVERLMARHTEEVRELEAGAAAERRGREGLAGQLEAARRDRELVEQQHAAAVSSAASAARSEEARRGEQAQRRRAEAMQQEMARNAAAAERKLSLSQAATAEAAEARVATEQQVGTLQGELQACQARLLDEGTALSAARRELDALRQSLELKESELAIAAEREQQDASSMESLQGTVGELRDELAGLRSELQAALEERAGAQAELAAAEAGLAAERTCVAQERAALSRAVERRHEVESQLTTAEASVTQLRGALGGAEAAAATAQAEASTHAAALLDGRKELRDARDAKEGAECLAAQLRAQVDSLALELRGSQQLQQSTELELQQRASELTAAHEHGDNLQKQGTKTPTCLPADLSLCIHALFRRWFGLHD
eukprot:COSAG01_NODE_65_length_29252_cov_173.296995_19_plen_730_part_00